MSHAAAKNDPPRRRATYDDLLKLPDHVVGELIDGELYASPRPAAPHAAAASALLGDIFVFGRGSGGSGGDEGGLGGWHILFEPELHLGADVLVPDLAGWRRERMPKIPNVAAFELVPDWVCEVVSPRTARLDRVKKLWRYAQVKVPHLWLVDPLEQTLEVYQLSGEHWMVLATHAGDEKVRAVPFDALEIALSHWWIETE